MEQAPPTLILSADDVLTLDEINADRRGLKDALEIALAFCANKVSETNKREDVFYRGVARRMGLPDNTIGFFTPFRDEMGRCVIRWTQDAPKKEE